MGARIKEHLDSQDLGLARRSSVPKVHTNPIHPGFQNRTTSTIGAPPIGAPPDASSPLPTDPSRPGKSFAVPAVTHGMKSDPQRGRYDPGLAEAVMSEAYHAPDDYAKKLHTVLPSAVQED